MNRSILTILVLCFVLGTAQAAENERMPAVAGQFYPADRDILSRSVDNYLSRVPPQTIQGRLIAVLTPHAGYEYSAQTAAYAFSLLKGRHVSTVILLGNSHHFAFDKAAVYARGRFNTPLGSLSVDESLARAVISEAPALIEENTAPHGPEHSLEVELPFIQRTLANVRIVPILLSDFSPSQCAQIGEAIARAVKKRGMQDTVLIVESSDMSHYPSWQDARTVDAVSLKTLARFDADLLQRKIAATMNGSVPNLACVFCGEKSLYAVMAAARELGARSVQVLQYANSGDVTGDKSRVVGYGAAAFIAPESNTKPKTSIPLKENTMNNTFTVSPKNQKELLALARSSIEQYLRNGKLPDNTYTDPQMLEPAAVFVTLTKNHQLRGCIGTTSPKLPLYKAVSQLAVAAATEDTRFPAVTQNELPSLHIEISVLSPLTQIKSADEIIPKVHGVVVRRGRSSGLFLPQVWEPLPNKEDFMCELCSQKAGLPRDAYKDPSTELYTFTVFAFEEK